MPVCMMGAFGLTPNLPYQSEQRNKISSGCTSYKIKLTQRKYTNTPSSWQQVNEIIEDSNILHSDFFSLQNTDMHMLVGTHCTKHIVYTKQAP